MQVIGSHNCGDGVGKSIGKSIRQIFRKGTLESHQVLQRLFLRPINIDYLLIMDFNHIHNTPSQRLLG